MTEHIQNQRILCDGKVLIYTRSDVAKPIWQCRIGFPDQPYIRVSLKTQSEKQAIKAAEKLYDDMRYRMERGLPLRSKTFNDALDAYLSWLEDEVENGSAKPMKLRDHKMFSRYMREYFDGKLIDRITIYDCERYRDWRRVYWTKGPGSKEERVSYQRNGRTVVSRRKKGKLPSKSTLAYEDVVLRAVFERAIRMGWINRDQMPEIVTTRAVSKRRPGFTHQEFRHLMAVSQKRIEEAANDARLSYSRRMLHVFVGFMAATGGRPFEIMKLKWKDLKLTDFNDDGVNWNKIYVSGKNKERELVALDDLDLHIDDLVELTRGKYCEEGEPFIPPKDEYVFQDRDGTPIGSFCRGFAALLKAAGLLFDSNGGRRDSYSLRHYYATMRLMAGVSVYTLATNMGTSVAMIEKHYGHLKPEMAAEELTK